ncbi:MAG: polyphosphate kinase 2 family protein [Armatimonadetes bacterium]|nr:polyphosphate kinase 2 family protein [Armatimonadota bacterium]
MGYAHRVDGERKIHLKDFDPHGHADVGREEAEEKTARLCEEMTELQEMLYAASQHSVLIVLQGRDTSGKDGTIRKVTGPLNAQGCGVSSFKVPTSEELAHDFLWRVHAKAPARGQIRIFNRSHYEDVLVVRVHQLVPEKAWRARYDHINRFEELLTDSGAIILKFYLHISRKEQEQRLLEREQDPTKSWKLSTSDWQEREYWGAYTEAYEDAISRCSTSHAPWHIVPADRKWFRNLAVAETIVEALRPCKKGWLAHLEEIGRREKAAIAELRRNHASAPPHP